MYVKLAGDGSVAKFPYSLSDLRLDHKHTSFPKTVDSEFLAQYNVFAVTELEAPSYDERTQKIEKATTPVIEPDDTWSLRYVVTNKTQAEIDEYDFTQGINTRITRNGKLASSDWIVTRAMEEGTQVPQEWVTYRQALRDITDHPNFPYLNEEDWPTKP